MPTDVKRSPGRLRPAAPEPAAPEAVTAGRLPTAATRRAKADRHSSHHPGPPNTRLLGLCVWATVIGVIGLAVAGRALLTVAAGTGPAWYEPTLSAVGTAGVAFTAAAFLTERRIRLPWLLLGLATVPVLVNVGLAFGAR